MVAKPDRVVTYYDELPFINSCPFCHVVQLVILVSLKQFIDLEHKQLSFHRLLVCFTSANWKNYKIHLIEGFKKNGQKTQMTMKSYEMFQWIYRRLLIVFLIIFSLSNWWLLVQLRFIFSLDLYFANYDHFMIIRDTNVQLNRERIKLLCESCKLKCLIKEPKCFKNPEYPSCIYLTLTNSLYYFQIQRVIEAGLSDIHKMTVT